MISSHVKITCYFHMWKYHRCYGYIIDRAFRRKKLFIEMVWYFIGVYKINRTLHGRLEIRTKCVFSCWKYFTRSLCSLLKYFSTLEEKFRISARPCNILYLYKTSPTIKRWLRFKQIKNSLPKSPTELEKVVLTFSSLFSLPRACARGDAR